MHRFYCPSFTLSQNPIRLREKKEIHHLKNVLRLRPGDSISAFNGKGQEATGIITEMSRDEITLEVKKVHSNANKSAIPLVLACALPKKAKFETIIEKCTELGIDRIIPVITKRTEIRIPPERKNSKTARFQTIAINAAKQSQRKTIPVIDSILSFTDALHEVQKDDLAFIPCLIGKREGLFDYLKTLEIKPQRIFFFIGPEGDFTGEEVENAIRHGCKPVSLGKTTLKVDTAAISVVSLVNFFFPHEK